MVYIEQKAIFGCQPNPNFRPPDICFSGVKTVNLSINRQNALKTAPNTPETTYTTVWDFFCLRFSFFER